MFDPSAGEPSSSRREDDRGDHTLGLLLVFGELRLATLLLVVQTIALDAHSLDSPNLKILRPDLDARVRVALNSSITLALKSAGDVDISISSSLVAGASPT